MKIALCLSGQPRFVTECAPSILQNLCDGYDVDVFSHTWFDEELLNKPYKVENNWPSQRISPDAVNQINEIYKPVSHKVEPSIKFKDPTIDYSASWPRYCGWGEQTEEFYNFIISNQISYFYSLNQVNILKKHHEYKNGFKYDWVIKCRTDCIVQSKVEFEKYDPNVINYTGINNQPDGMICDWLDFGGSKVMDVLLSAFSVYDFPLGKCIEDNNGAFCPELVHRKMIDFFGIDKQPHPISVSLPRF